MQVKDEELELDQDELLDQETEEQEEQVDNPDLEFETDDDGFEIISDEDANEEQESENERLKREMQEMQQQFQTLQMQQQPSNSNSNDEGFSQLGEILKQMQQNQSKPKEEKQPQIDWKKKRSEWTDQIFDKPIETLDDYTQTNVLPAFNMLQNKIATLEKQLNRQNTSSDPKYSKIMQKYGSEVDEWAASFKDDPDAYKKAAAMVGMQHFDEMLEEEKKAALESMQEEKKGKQKVSYTGTERQPNPQGKKKKKRIVLTQNEQREFDKAFALSPLATKKEFYDRIWSRKNNK